jgi:hypothetical protein
MLRVKERVVVVQGLASIVCATCSFETMRISGISKAAFA